MAEVKLLGAYFSPYSFRAVCALKLKGIPYEFVEEDLMNKSSSLLQYNPVYKKIPVLVHDGKPICESIVILEYLDEIWPECPLLPTEPYERAVARFWIKYVEDKSPAMWVVFRTSGQEQEKAVKETVEMLKTIEENAMGEKKYFGGDKINMVDIAYSGIAYWLGGIEEVVGIKMLEPQKFPRLHAWTRNFNETPVIKDNLPDRDSMFALFKRSREMILASA
ncbi:hypothetical protein JCGZ_12917 [Jatropha curcas]|uniref:glutathione transferase n=1 Tax=Jatropha curcas TaxID=180498 RepID=A0A067KEE4_JATCU|nr:probable glutathione S-transferase [Jatropha curcas]KDP33368.1 hypothetical protein JCGZ_12917 [Jatropha curcas]